MADKNYRFKRIQDLKGIHPKNIKDLHMNNGHGAFANYQKTDQETVCHADGGHYGRA